MKKLVKSFLVVATLLAMTMGMATLVSAVEPTVTAPEMIYTTDKPAVRSYVYNQDMKIEGSSAGVVIPVKVACPGVVQIGLVGTFEKDGYISASKDQNGDGFLQTGLYDSFSTTDTNLSKFFNAKTAGTYFTTESNYSSAKSKLAGNINITYKIIKTLSKLDDGLLKGDYESVFVSAAQYKTMCEKVSNFKSKTRIIYTIRIDVSQKDLSKKVDVTQNSFNIYVSGLDTSGNIREMSRSDVNMIVTVNPKTHVVLLTSIPRDYEIQLPSYNNATDKLTHTGIYGIQETIGAVEKLTGIDMNYYVKVNYSTVRRFVDAIGGIDVYSDYDFTTHGMAVQYTFRKGKNHLDGKKALAFARERKSFEDGDVQRNRDQAKVMSAIISKCTSSTTILARYSTILNSCKQYMEINMEAAQIKQLVKMQVNGGYKWKIRKQNVEGNSVLETCYSSGDYQVYVMKPDDDDVTNATDKIIGVMDGTVR